MIKEKSIQIPVTLYNVLVQYFLLELQTPENTAAIKKGLEDKVEAIIRHDLYTKYKTSPSTDQKEQARQEYLDRIGMHKDFRE